MSKVRVYELARDLKIESKVLMSTLKSIGVSLPSHQSILTDDQLAKLKAALSGKVGTSSGASAASAAPNKESAAGSSVRVIRRRRGNEADESAATTSGSEQPDQTPEAASSETNDVSASAAQVAPAADSFAAGSKPIESVSTSAEAPSVKTADAINTAPESAAATIGTGNSASATVEPTNAISNKQQTQRVGAVQPPRENTTDDKKRPPRTGFGASGGATIVRKASPEEMRARQTKTYENTNNNGSRPPYSGGGSGGSRPPYNSGSGNSGGGYQGNNSGGYQGGSGGNSSSNSNNQRRPFTRREDSQGTKYTGFSAGFSGPAAGGAGGGGLGEEIAGDPSRALRKAREKTNKTKEVEEVEEAIAAKKPAKSAKRAALNLRQLLSEADELEAIESDSAISESESAAAAALLLQQQQRTVYTPTSRKRKDLKRRRDLKKTEITVSRQAYRTVRFDATITAGELAIQLKVKSAEIIKKLMDQGIMVTVNQPLDMDTAAIVASDYGYDIRDVTTKIEDIIGRTSNVGKTTGSISRPPIVTVMGHVDHGKTSILDAVRKTQVAAGEAGGITQHIGAYQVVFNGHKITFLDTPGHEAFSSMRARGANCTDIVVLVVAADDGVMPQTIEAISHAKDAGVPIVVAVNKIDKEQANVDRIYRELSEHGVIAEEWGGDVQFVKCSALTKQGIDDLLEALFVQSEVLELKANIGTQAEGVVVEAHLDQGRGPIATILVRNGSLKAGDFVVTGAEFGKVRAMYDHLNKKVDVADPSTPIQILGLSGVPLAGDVVTVVNDEKTAREAASWVIENQRKKSTKTSAQSLDDLMSKMKTSDTPELPIILKADTQGSLEAIVESLTKLNSDRVRNRVVHRGVGAVSESDIALSEAAGSVIIGFNVRAARGLDEDAQRRGIVLKYFSIIYDLTDSIRDLMAGKLPSILEESVVGRAEVRQTISVPKIGVIAGSSVTDGKITRSSNLRLVRDGVVIYSGKISSLRRFKDDVKEVKSGFECGIGIENYNDLKMGDVIEAYEIKETRPTL